MDELTDWLDRHGLSRLGAAMIENDIDLALLPELTEQDLKDLGLNIGQRRRLLNAIRTELIEQPASADQMSAQAATEPIPQVGRADAAEQAERRQLTVLFCDLVGSTELSQRLDPEELRETMRAYQDAAAGAVTRYGGHVAKYLGDGVLAYFGWPVAHEDQSERAVRAGLEMSQAVGAITASHGTQLAARIGIASGDVVIGDLVNVTGTEAGAVSGHTPNLAARLQSVAGPGEVMISNETRRLAGAAFEIESRGTYTLKGFNDPVPGYAVLREREVESRFEATRGVHISPLVGRVHEIGLLTERWHQAQAGQGTVVLLSGEAGIGKSRLVEAMAKRVSEDGGETIRLQCSPYFASSALHPVIERIRRIAGIAQGDDDAAQLAKLRDLLAREGDDPEATLQIYAKLLSIEMPPDSAGPDLMPEEVKERTLQVLLRRPIQLSRKAPLLLLLEDAHWIDPSTLELMEQLVARVAELPVMMVVTHRPEWNTDWSGTFGHVTALTVGRLDRVQIGELMEKTFGYAASPDLVDDIAQRTEGVPLFIEEFCQAIAGQTDADAAGEVTIPATLQGSLMSRLDRLPKVARSLALVASVIGREFDAALLKQVTGITPAALEDGLAALRRMQVIFQSGSSPGSYVFRHALIQDTAYQSLLKRTRQSHHRKVARTLETSHPEILAREPELVAHHYSAAGDDDAARPLWMRAAERAYSRSAAFEAVSHAREALRIAKGRGRHEIEAHILLGRARQSAGQIGPAIQTLREAIDLARALDNDTIFADAVLTFANTLYLSMEPAAEALPLLEEALSQLPDEKDVLSSQILSYLVRGSVLAGERDRARRYRARAIEAARSCGDNVSLHSMQIIPYIVPVVHRETEEVTSWRSRINEMLETANQMNDDTKGRSRSIAFYVAAEMGDRDQMEQMLALIKEVGEARQHMHMAWVDRHGEAMLAILDGRFEEAERLSNEALQIGRQTHGEEVEGVYGIQMFTIRREQGRLGEVAPVMKRLVDDDPGATTWKPGFAVIASDLGYEAPARRVLDEMAEGDFALALDSKYSTTLSYLAEVATRLGDEERCERLYELLLPYRDLTITAGVTTVCVGAADRYLGLLASAVGDWEIAETHFREAIALDERMRAGPWLAHTQHELANMLEKRGMIGDDVEIADLREKVIEAASKFGMKALHNKYSRYLQ